MFMKMNNILFMFFLIISTLMVISSSNWVMGWLCLEINLMSMIPLLMFKTKFNNSSSSMKYFLIQALASIMLFMGITLTSSLSDLSSMINNNDLVNLSLALKLGMPPFHFWVSQIIELINMIKISLILIWQKIAPMILMSYSLNMLIMSMIMVSALVGAIGGINQNNIKKILFYSSVNHMAWMMSSLMINDLMWIMYMTAYSAMLIPIMTVFYSNKMNSITKISFMTLSFAQMFMILILVLALAGLPPLMGFTMKVMIIMILSLNYWTYSVSSVLIVSSVVSIFYYFKMIWTSLINNSSKNKTLSKKSTKNSNMMMLFAISINLVSPQIMWFY